MANVGSDDRVRFRKTGYKQSTRHDALPRLRQVSYIWLLLLTPNKVAPHKSRSCLPCRCSASFAQTPQRPDQEYGDIGPPHMPRGHEVRRIPVHRTLHSAMMEETVPW